MRTLFLYLRRALQSLRAGVGGPLWPRRHDVAGLNHASVNRLHIVPGSIAQRLSARISNADRARAALFGPSAALPPVFVGRQPSEQLIAPDQAKNIYAIVGDLDHEGFALGTLEQLPVRFKSFGPAAWRHAPWAMFAVLIPGAHPDDSLTGNAFHKRPLGVTFSAGEHAVVAIGQAFRFHSSTLPDRSFKRNRPLVLSHAGGNA